MTILVCGGRHFEYYNILSMVLNQIIGEYVPAEDEVEVVSGGCAGTDKLAEKYAQENNYILKVFPAEWSKYGKAAGPIRNQQMVDYIKDKNSIVVAFTSVNTKGTRHTMQQAQKYNIPVFEIPYEMFEEAVELYEGVRKTNVGDYELDWDVDFPEDLIKLKGSCIHITKYHKHIRCYGYKINKTEQNHQGRKEFLTSLKTQNSTLREELISRCIEDFYDKCPIKHFDYVLITPSKSTLNTDILHQLTLYDDFETISLVKKPVASLALNMDKLEAQFHGNYLEKFVKYLQGVIEQNKKRGSFSISTFRPQFRRYLQPMIAFGNKTIEGSADKNILLIDDIFTSGGTMDMILELLEEIDFQGNVTILTLLQNR